VKSETTPAYVTRNADGGWRVAGTRVSLDSIVEEYWQGRLPEAIAADFPVLSLEQVHGAIAFYLRNRAEIDQHLAERDSRWQEIQQEITSRYAPLLQRKQDTADRSVPGASQ